MISVMQAEDSLVVNADRSMSSAFLVCPSRARSFDHMESRCVSAFAYYMILCKKFETSS